MSLQDFESCTPLEFEETAGAYAAREQASVRAQWEQARFIAMSALQPYSKKALKPEDICLFAWEKKSRDALKAAPSTKERMQEIAARCGMKCD